MLAYPTINGRGNQRNCGICQEWLHLLRHHTDPAIQDDSFVKYPVQNTGQIIGIGDAKIHLCLSVRCTG